MLEKINPTLISLMFLAGIPILLSMMLFYSQKGCDVHSYACLVTIWGDLALAMIVVSVCVGAWLLYHLPISAEAHVL